MLEYSTHAVSWWVTLTYDEDHLPFGPSLVPRHLTLWLKRIRKAAEPFELRYFAVGEYGDETQRPHYHAAVFGRVEPRELERCWENGHVQVRPITKERLQYLAGYVVKKWTKEDEFNREKLALRHPEFARMSRRPGIGGRAVADFAGALTSRNGSVVVGRSFDVPSSYRQHGAMWPFGRYLKTKIRERVLGDEKEPLVARAARRLRRSRDLRNVVDGGESIRRDRLNRLSRLSARERIFKKGRVL